MKTKIICLFAVLFLFSVVNSQSWGDDINTEEFNSYEGSMLPHMFSTVVWLTNPTVPGNASTVATEFDAEGTFPNANIFGTLDKIYYATSLFDIQFAAFTEPQRYFSVESLNVNSGRTGYTLKVLFHEKILGSNNETQYTKLGLSLMIVGSSFSGQNGYVESSYVYPRNGILRDVLYETATTPIAQFDFRNNQEKSPFDYLPGTQLSDKCGMIKQTANSDRVVELRGCAYYRFLTFVTGFTVQSTVGQTAQQLDIAAIVVSQADQANVLPTDNVEITGANSIYKEDTDDTEVGIWINYVTQINTASSGPSQFNAEYNILRLQLSFIFVGIRSFTQSNTILDYPVQHLYRQDNFVHYASRTPYSQTAGVHSPVDSTNAAIVPLVSLMYNPTAIATTIQYADTIGVGFGNAFCGFQSIFLADNADVLDIEIDNNFQQNNQIGNNFGTVGNQYSFKCAFFRRRNPCDGTPKILQPLSGTSGYDLTGSNFVIGISADSLSVGDVSGLGSFRFEFTQLVDANSVGNIKTIYNRAITTASVFKVNVQFEVNSALPADGIFNEFLRITAFGKVIFEKTFSEIDDYIQQGFSGAAPYLRQFYVYSIDPTQNQVLFQYRQQGVFKITSIEVAVQQFGNTIEGVQCLSACPEQTGFISGLNPTTDPPSCIYCKQSDNLEPDFISGCRCVDGYYFDGTDQTCKICSVSGIPLCGICDSTGSSCEQCAQNSNTIRNAITGVIQGCQCRTGFYASGSQCLPCPFGCSACISASSCTACHPNINTDGQSTRILPTCQCRVGFYENNNDFVCPACSNRCLSCSNSANQCTDCDQANNFVPQGNTCVCRTGFYQLSTGTSVTCQRCDLSCLTCSTSSLYCDSCNIDDFRQLAGRVDGTKRCDCIQGYKQIQGICIDKQCRSVTPFCQTCAYNPILLRTQCMSCGANRYIQDGECVCKVGFYTVGTGQNAQCKPCGSGCELCGIRQGQLRCFECADRARTNDDGSCSCPTGTVVVEAADNLMCKTCDLNCASCVGSPDNCDSCAIGFTLQSNKCVCGLGTYLSTSRTKCLPCMDNCNVCSRTNFGTLECITCAQDYVFNGIQCALSCPNGKYNAGSKCQDCPSECSSCITPSLCLSCQSGFNLFAGSCRKKCPLGTLPVNEECLACLSPCSSCTGSATSCDSCVDGYLLFNQNCVKDCPPSTYFGDSSCLACSPRCLTCSGTSGNCQTCANTQFLFNNDCFDTCPAAMVNGTCTDVCPDGKYYQNSNCLDCDPKCMTCKGSAGNCTACANGYITYAGACLNQCPRGTYKSGNTCVRCDESCAQCSESSIKCTSCTNGYVKQGHYCVQKCHDGFYKDNSGFCKECGTGCKTCTSSNSCSQCFDSSLTPSFGKCMKMCPPGSMLNGDKCVCTFGVLHENSCVTSCPEGYYPWNKVCTECQYPCKACVGSGNSCTKCIDGYSLNQATKKCSRQNKCPYGQYEHDNNCVSLCSSSLVYHSGGCLYQCPSGYHNNGYGGCIKKTSPSVCPIGKYQQGSSCLDSCISGYFANHHTYICEKCSQGCELCLKEDYCVKCEDNYIFENGACAPKINCSNGWVQFNGKCYQGCPPGSYSNGHSCSLVCRQGTYFWNPFCYATCPTAYHTDYACMNNCPNGYQARGKQCHYMH